MSGLPAGWREGALGEVCAVTSGGTPSTTRADYWSGNIPWVTPADMSRDRSQVLSAGERFITEAGLAASSAKVFSAGSVIVSSRAPVGYVAIAGVDMATNQGCKTATPPTYIDPRYLYWFLVNAKPDLEARASGTTFKEISGRRFAETRLWWPRLDEQRRIVAILEDHLSRLDAAMASLDVAAQKIDAWREAEVDSALWTPGVETVPILTLLREPMRNGRSDRASPDGHGTRTLTITAVTKNDFSERNTKITLTSAGAAEGLWLEPGDIFVQRSNTPELVGSAARYDGPRKWAIFPDLLIRLRADESKVASEYLAAALRSRRVHRTLRAKSKGLAGSMPKIDQGTIGSTTIPLVAVPEQYSLMSRLAEVEDSAQTSLVAIDSQRRRATALRRSLLAAAFRGELGR